LLFIIMLRPVFELGSQRSGSLFLSVALIVTSEGEAQRLLPWAWRMAVAERMDLVLLRVQQRDEITALTTIDVPEEMERVAPGVLELWQQLNQGQTGLLSEPAIDESAAARVATNDQAALASSSRCRVGRSPAARRSHAAPVTA
jgi:hypothetical protein